MNRFRYLLLILAVGLVVGGIFACRRAAAPLPDVTERPGNSGLTTKTFGDEQLVVLDQGNLARAPAATPEERVSAFGSFLLDHRDFFGAGEAKPENIMFTAAAPEFTAARQRSETYALVALHQLHQGARVVDETQYAVFLLDSSGRVGELRRVRAHLRDPARLPTPPSANPEQQRTADELFRNYLRGRSITGGDVKVEETPVISVRLQTAGYLARYSMRNEDGSMSRLAAVVTPSTGQLKVLYDIAACQAGLARKGDTK
ncbi:MAG TPA: hypothetical protein VM911_00225 [Pyrinomonadaceae bacterium]|jgi:hypothetical protein|nr:hypothetical protein [Pyrinomonadaceae bacterium]